MDSHALQYVQIFQGEAVVDVQPCTPITVVTTRRRFLTKTSSMLVPGMTDVQVGEQARFDIIRDRLHFFAPDGERIQA